MEEKNAASTSTRKKNGKKYGYRGTKFKIVKKGCVNNDRQLFRKYKE